MTTPQARAQAPPMRVLLLKPYQPVRQPLCQPPLGILYLAGALRERFGTNIEVTVRDLRLHQENALAFAAEIVAQGYDIVGISSLNFEAEVSHGIAQYVKRHATNTITAIGGPYPHSSLARVKHYGGFDWIFDGEAERTFPAAVACWHQSRPHELGSIAGLTWWDVSSGSYRSNGCGDTITDLDALPRPAWDTVDFDVYARRPNMNGWLKGTRYAPIFTSRGCPYKCNYCHDVFGKKFRWRSDDDVVAEIAYLHERHGIDEFQIIDDIFNLHKPRMRRIATKIIDRFGPRRLNFCFPNGVRADILDPEDLPLLRDMGVFQISVAVETVTTRLQSLVEKHLDIDKVRTVIAACADNDIVTKGFFMLGFPTETWAELQATIDFAVSSKLTFAGFYLVVPQEGTPIYHLAKTEDAAALEQVALKDFYNEASWYQLTYGTDMRKLQKQAFRRFFLQPTRMWRIARVVSPTSLVKGFLAFLHIATVMDPVLGRHGRQKASLTKLQRQLDIAPPATLAAKGAAVAKPAVRVSAGAAR